MIIPVRLQLVIKQINIRIIDKNRVWWRLFLMSQQIQGYSQVDYNFSMKCSQFVKEFCYTNIIFDLLTCIVYSKILINYFHIIQRRIMEKTQDQLSLSSSLFKCLQASHSKNKASYMSNQTLDRVFNDIQSNVISISKEKKPFLQKHLKNQFSPKKLEQMRKKKQVVQRQLKYLQMEQSKLKHSHISNNSSYNDKFKSELTKDQLNKIKQIIKNQTNFIKSLQQKQKVYFESLDNFRKQNIALQERQKMEKCEERKKQIKIKMEELSKLQQQRKINFKLQQEELEKIRNQKKLHEDLQQKQKEKLKLQEQKVKQYTKALRKQNKFNLQGINQHHKKYQIFSKEKSEERLFRSKQFQSKQRLNFPKIQHSKFFINLKEEQQIKKAQQAKKAMQKQQLVFKKEQYNRLVKEKHKPRQKTKNQDQDDNQQEVMQPIKKPSLQLQEIQNLGNDYMKEVHKKIKKMSPSQSKIDTIYSQKPQKIHYKNYLNDLKSKHGKQNQQGNKIEQIKKLMSDISISQSQKMQRAKLIAKRLQKKESHNKGLINSINAKLQILRQISQ